jgi:hypothetical protein
VSIGTGVGSVSGTGGGVSSFGGWMVMPQALHGTCRRQNQPRRRNQVTDAAIAVAMSASAKG